MAAMLVSCGKKGDAARISALEERMSEVQDPVGKTELANRLHKEYAIYHLQYEDDTLYLRDWAEMAMEGREYEEAIEVYSMLLERGGVSPAVYVARAGLYAGLGYYQEAFSDYEKAAEMLPADASKKREEYQYWSDYYNQADAVIRREGESIAVGDHPAIHHLNRAEQYIKCGYYSAAVADIRTVFTADTANTRAQYLLAKAFLASGEYDRSGQEFETYFSMATPEDENYAEALEQKQQLDLMSQLDELEGALKSEPYSYQTLVDASATAFRLKNYNRAMLYASRLTEVFPDSIFGYLYRGQVHIQAGDTEQALSDMNRVLELDPSNISARNLRAYVFLLKKDDEAVRQEIREIKSRGGTLLEVLKSYDGGFEK